MEYTDTKNTLSYANLADLAKALTMAVSGNLMSLEEAKFLWKRHMISIGWKKDASTLDVATIKKTEIKVKTKK